MATPNSTLSLTSTLAISPTVSIPVVGLGVYLASSGDECEDAVRWALEAGYRHIDTAAVYGNEESVGRALQSFLTANPSVSRDDITIVSKLWNSSHGYAATLAACEESLSRLQTHIDVYLVHWPVPDKRKDTWRAMEHLLETNKVRAIGVSNYMVHHLRELLAECSVKPAVNQVELSPYLTREELLAFCAEHKIVVEAYSPLTKARKLRDPKLLKIAKRYKKTAAQVLIRWSLQRGCVVLPKSTNKKRIQENADVFDFALVSLPHAHARHHLLSHNHLLQTDEDMTVLNSFDEGLVTGWDPTDAP